MSKPTVIQVHLAVIRLCRQSRITKRAARKLIPYMYTGPAACQYIKAKKRSQYAITEELMAEMEKIYIHGVSPRQASKEIRKLRLSATTSSCRAAADDLIEHAFSPRDKRGHRKRHFGCHRVPRHDCSTDVSFTKESTCI
jgi:hypothetical protein